MEGKFPLNLVRVAEDGAVYACSLKVAFDTTPHFRVYRWANDGSNTPPALVWQGDPFPGTSTGDSMDIRGSGDATQILVANYLFYAFSGLKAALITPSLGVESEPIALTIPGGYFVWGPSFVAFGPGDTFWVKPGSYPLQYVSFNGTQAAILATYPILPTMAGLGINYEERKLAIIAMDSPDYLGLYDLPNLTNGLSWIDAEFFTHPLDAPNFGLTGSVEFRGNRIFAANANNGILACKILPTLHSSRDGNWLNLSWAPQHTLQMATSVDGSFVDVNTTSPHSVNLNSSPTLFFRLKMGE